MKLHRPFDILLFALLLLHASGCSGQQRDSHSTARSYFETIDSIRQAKDATFRDLENSPLPGLEDIAAFRGLPYYPIDTTYRITARVELTPDAEPFVMETTTDREARYVQHGILHFTLHGTAYTLHAYRNLENKGEPYLFVPFRDATTGETTYGGGRYLDIRVPLDATEIELDFNKAYHPYCVYNYKYSCPIPPPENTLPVALKAGERLSEAP